MSPGAPRGWKASITTSLLGFDGAGFLLQSSCLNTSDPQVYISQILRHTASFWGNAKAAVACGSGYSVYLEKQTGVCIFPQVLQVDLATFGGEQNIQREFSSERNWHSRVC